MRRCLLAFLTLGLPGCLQWLPQDPPPRIVPVQQPDAFTSADAKPTDASFEADAPVTQRNPSRFPGVPGQMVIGNATGAARTVRVRALRPTVQLDCDMVAVNPSVMLSRRLFSPASTWLLASGRAIGVGGGDGRACTALLVDGGGVPMHLLFWREKDHGFTTLPSTVNGAPVDRLLALQAGEAGVDFAPRLEVLAPPPLFEPGPAPGCGVPDATGGLAWSLPVPLGNLTILALASAPDGCMQLTLLGKLGTQDWTLCLPPGAFPFEEGEDYFAAPLTGGHNLEPIDGFELLAEKRKLRFGRGDDLVYFGAGALKLQAVAGCSGWHDACGDLQSPLVASILKPGQPEAAVVAGSQFDLGNGGQLHVLQASSLPVLDSACPLLGQAGAKLGQRHVESVFVQVTP